MKWFVPPPAPMTEEVKEMLIQEHPSGLRVVLDEEFPSDCAAAGDLIGINSEDRVTLLIDEPPATGLLQ
jgi:hypothetical protein